MTLKTRIDNMIKNSESTAAHPHQHRISFQNGEYTDMYMSAANSISVSYGSVSLNSNALITGNFPPSSNCGSAISVNYMGMNTPAELQQAQNMLNTVQNIKTQNSYYASYNSQISSYNTTINALNSDIRQLNTNIQNLKSNDKDHQQEFVDSLNPSRKAHLLSKIWQKNDVDSNHVKDLIKSQGFNANYYLTNGTSLFQMALASNDNPLMDQLFKNGLNLSARIGNDLVFAKIMESNDQGIKNMAVNSNSIEKALFTATFTGDIAPIATTINMKPQLTKIEFNGKTLLQYAIIKHNYEIAECIIKTDNSAIDFAASNQTTVAGNIVNSSDVEGIKLLTKYNFNFNDIFKKNLCSQNADNIKFILKNVQHINITNLKDDHGNTALHVAAKCKDADLISTCIDIQQDLLGIRNDDGQLSYEYAQANGIDDIDLLTPLMG